MKPRVSEIRWSEDASPAVQAVARALEQWRDTGTQILGCPAVYVKEAGGTVIVFGEWYDVLHAEDTGLQFRFPLVFTGDLSDTEIAKHIAREVIDRTNLDLCQRAYPLGEPEAVPLTLRVEKGETPRDARSRLWALPHEVREHVSALEISIEDVHDWHAAHQLEPFYDREQPMKWEGLRVMVRS